MVLDVFDVVMFTNIGGKGWVKKIRMLGVQTLGLSEAGDSWGVNVFYKRWASPRPFVILVRLISIKYLFFKKKFDRPRR